MTEKYRNVTMSVKYSYDEPVSSGLLRAGRNTALRTGKLVIEKEGDFFNALLYAGSKLLASSSLDFLVGENFIDGDEGPIYLNVDLSDLREELYSRYVPKC